MNRLLVGGYKIVLQVKKKPIIIRYIKSKFFIDVFQFLLMVIVGNSDESPHIEITLIPKVRKNCSEKI